MLPSSPDAATSDPSTKATSPPPGPPAVATTSPAGVAVTKPGPALGQAILVIHGIGQQRPFQALDSFVNGLRAALRGSGKAVNTTHLMLGRDEVFDHCVRIEETNGTGGSPRPRLDIYEFYWAPLTQGKASFAQVARWLAVAGFSPVWRLAFNLPLLIRRAEGRAQRWAEHGQGERGVSPTQARGAPGVARPGLTRLLAAAQGAIAESRTFWFCLEFAREVWRFVYVSLAAVLLAGLATWLVSRSSNLVKHLPKALGPVLGDVLTVPGAVTAGLALVAVVAAIGLGFSIPEQIRDLVRLQKNEPLLFDEAGRVARTAFTGGAGEGFFTRLRGAAKAGIRSLRSTMAARMQWQKELPCRRWALPLSVLGFGIAAGVVIWLSLPGLPCAICPGWPTPTFHDLLTGLATWDVGAMAFVLIAAFGLKRVFIDYLADVALYTTADENSAFFATRTAILEEATHRIRVLLGDDRYASVAVAGHSLGSVIGYDAISALRVDAARPRRDSEQRIRDEIRRLAEKLPPDDAAAVSELVDELAGARPRQFTRPPSDREIAKLNVFITFGSPLNKVLYFFRTKVKIYETVRAHIVQELHGFRQVPDLLTRDPTIDDRSRTIADGLRWVNVYSPMDPVSARLVFYSGVHEHRRWFLLWGKCHLSYWHDPKFFREVLAALQGRCADEAEAAIRE